MEGPVLRDGTLAVGDWTDPSGREAKVAELALMVGEVRIEVLGYGRRLIPIRRSRRSRSRS